MYRFNHPTKFILLTAIIFSHCKPATDSSTEPLFSKISSVESGVLFSNTNVENVDQNILAYDYFYNGGGVALGDVNNDGLVDLYFSSNQGENRLYLNRGNFRFEDITQNAGVSAASGWKTGVSMVDINADGFLDIYVCRSGNAHPLLRYNSLYINNQNLTFTEQALAYGIDNDSYSTHASFLDFDKDGDLDMFLLNHSRLNISNSYDISTRYKTERVQYVGNILFRNDNGKFIDVSDSIGIYGPASNYGLGVAYSDLNNDGWLDIYTTNDYTEKDKLFLNDGGTFFNEATDSLLTHMSQFSMGVDIADINNDGYLDIVTLDMLPESNKLQKEFYWPDRYDVYAEMVKNGRHHQYMRNMLQLNNGNGTFSEIGQLAGVSNTHWSWAALFADYDNDGLQDLFVSNGFKRNFTSNDFLKYSADLSTKAKEGNAVVNLKDVLAKIPPAKEHNYMFQNNDGISFTDVSNTWGFEKETLTNGAAYADLDNDGDLDLVTNNLDDEVGLFRNNTPQDTTHHYLKLKLIGNNNNTFGLGASATVYCKGKLMTRTLCPYRGFQSSVEPALFFGLGKNCVMDSLIVVWPTGETQRMLNIKANQFLTVSQNDAAYKSTRQSHSLLFAEAKNVLKFKHIENPFVDFKVQPLLPRMYSTMGPAIAAGDINSDGLLDLYIGGAKGQEGRIFIQHKSGMYAENKQATFLSDVVSEDIDAIFFDMDRDGDQDLYVVSGGYEFNPNDQALQDRLYRNDGKGNFRKVVLPSFLASGSCVRPADMDGDGDLDLFIGSRIIPGRYPETPSSYILKNDGKGNFEITDNVLAASSGKIGLVTDAVWADLNNDNQLDLVVVGEWMPIMVYINTNGKLIDQTTQLINDKTNGWWNRIITEDLDGDGDKDFLIGNFGMNNQYKPSHNKPVSLYFADYDRNGSIDPIMNYFIGDRSYPMPTRDQLTEQLPGFKKRFPDYESYSTATIETMLTPEERAQSTVLSAYTFQTSYLQNREGTLVLKPLSLQLQYSPVFDFAVTDVNHDGIKDIIAVGNLAEMPSRFGKATGNFGTVLLGNGKGDFTYLPAVESGLSIRGNTRKIVQDGNTFIFGVNNESTVVYKLNGKSAVGF